MARFKVVGVKRFEGVVDGKALKSGKLYVEVRLDDSRNSADQHSKGYFTEELKKVDPELIKRIEHIPLPAIFELDTERVGNGRESHEVVLDIRPVDLVKPASAKAA